MKQQSAVIIGVGAEQGIGGALCRRFAREGLHVIAGGRTAAKLGTATVPFRCSNGSGTRRA